mgnify:CR=1 FL=1
MTDMHLNADQTTDTISETSSGQGSGSGLILRFVHGTGLIVLIYLSLYALYAVQQPKALTSYSIAALFNNTAPLALAAAGQAIIVISRGFDLSVAGVISICNVVLAVWPMEGPGGAALSVFICLAIGTAVGAVNGYLVAVLKLQSIAATLATMIICQGIALVILKAPGGWVAEWISYEMTDRLWGVIPVSGLVLGAVLLVWFVLRRTSFGISLYAIGADEPSAALSGINTVRVRFMAHVIAGCAYGVAGFMLSAQTATGNPTAGTPLLMLTFAAVALGGTSLAGGRGGVFATMMGAATLTLLQKVLFSSGISSFYTGVFQGFVLILAVVFSSFLIGMGDKK